MKITENSLLVLGKYEGREGHAIQRLDVVPLVRLFRCILVSLDLKHSPPVVVEYGEVWEALLVLGVVLEDDAARKQISYPLDETGLVRVLTLSSHVTSSGKKYNS